MAFLLLFPSQRRSGDEALGLTVWFCVAKESDSAGTKSLVNAAHLINSGTQLTAILVVDASLHPTFLSATEFHRFLDNKFIGICHNASQAPAPELSPLASECCFSSFRKITAEMIYDCINCFRTNRLVDISLLKLCFHLLSPFIAFLFNASMSTCAFPVSWKNATITPLPKSRI